MRKKLFIFFMLLALVSCGKGINYIPNELAESTLNSSDDASSSFDNESTDNRIELKKEQNEIAILGHSSFFKSTFTSGSAIKFMTSKPRSFGGQDRSFSLLLKSFLPSSELVEQVYIYDLTNQKKLQDPSGGCIDNMCSAAWHISLSKKNCYSDGTMTMQYGPKEGIYEYRIKLKNGKEYYSQFSFLEHQCTTNKELNSSYGNDLAIYVKQDTQFILLSIDSGTKIQLGSSYLGDENDVSWSISPDPIISQKVARIILSDIVTGETVAEKFCDIHPCSLSFPQNYIGAVSCNPGKKEIRPGTYSTRLEFEDGTDKDYEFEIISGCTLSSGRKLASIEEDLISINQHLWPFIAFMITMIALFFFLKFIKKSTEAQ